MARMPQPLDTDMNPAGGAFADGSRALMALPRGFITGASLLIDGGVTA